VASDLRRKEQLPELTKRIVETYREVGSINHLGHCPLPNYDVVVTILEDLKEILFPGFRRRGLHFDGLPRVGDLIGPARQAHDADRSRTAARSRPRMPGRRGYRLRSARPSEGD
jgi:serine O-acetyltransferase